ncbi:MAG: hypothetical protein ACAH95_12285 [Fimbriimonas sp.]
MQIPTDSRTKREKRKSTIYGVVCLVMSASIFAMFKLWYDFAERGQRMPPAAYAALLGVGVLYLAIGINCLRAAKSDFKTDRSFGADLFWATAIFLFVTLTASGMAAGEQGASTASNVGLALLIIGGVYKLIDAIKRSELKIRETLLERIAGEEPPVTGTISPVTRS